MSGRFDLPRDPKLAAQKLLNALADIPEENFSSGSYSRDGSGRDGCYCLLGWINHFKSGGQSSLPDDYGRDACTMSVIAGLRKPHFFNDGDIRDGLVPHNYIRMGIKERLINVLCDIVEGKR